jgi:hypothetical protein
MSTTILAILEIFMHKRFTKLILISLICLDLIIVFIAAATTILPTLVLDSKNIYQLPLYIRSTAVTLPNKAIRNTRGLADLHCIGSTQFSALQLQALKDKFPYRIFIIDLRQESHGFINGNAISWYGRHNWSNREKTPQQINVDEMQRLAQIKNFKSVAIDISSDKNQSGKNSYEELPVQKVQSEAEVAAQYDCGYARLYVTDHMAPDPATVDQFIQLYRHIPKDAWLYIHCLGGIDRTTMFMMMWDMMHNAKTVSLTDIKQRHFAMTNIDLFKQPSAKTYHATYILARINFLNHFYAYCKANHDNYHTTWQEWLNSHPL